MKKQWRDDLDTWASPIMTNLLWVLFCMPLITIPLALAGLFACMYHWMDDRRTQVFSIFFGTIRKVWLKAYMLFVLDLLIGGFLVFNFLIFMQMELNPLSLISLGTTLISTVIFLAANIPAWVLLAVWDVPFKQTVTLSIKLVILQPFWTIAMVVIFVILTALTLLVFPAAVLVTVTGAFAGYIASFGTKHIVSQYINGSEFQLLDVI